LFFVCVTTQTFFSVITFVYKQYFQSDFTNLFGSKDSHEVLSILHVHFYVDSKINPSVFIYN